MQGLALGLQDEAPNLYRQAEGLGDELARRMQVAVPDVPALVARMRSAVASNAGQFTAGLLSEVNYQASLSAGAQAAANRTAQRATPQSIENHIVIDGREFAIVTTPYIEEEMGYR